MWLLALGVCCCCVPAQAAPKSAASVAAKLDAAGQLASQIQAAQKVGPRPLVPTADLGPIHTCPCLWRAVQTWCHHSADSLPSVPSRTHGLHAVAYPLEWCAQNFLAASVDTPPVPPGVSAAVSAQRAASARREAGTKAATVALQTSPFCGDGVCDAGENCATCAQDCKQVRCPSLPESTACACARGREQSEGGMRLSSGHHCQPAFWCRRRPRKFLA